MAGLPPGTDGKGMGEREELAWCRQGWGWHRSCACVRLGKGGRGGRMELGREITGGCGAGCLSLLPACPPGTSSAKNTAVLLALPGGELRAGRSSTRSRGSLESGCRARGAKLEEGEPRLEEQDPEGTIQRPCSPLRGEFPPGSAQFRGATRVAEGWGWRWHVPGATSLPALFIVPAWGLEVIREERAALRFLLLDRLFPRSPDLSLGKLSASPPRRVCFALPHSAARRGALGRERGSINSSWGCQIPPGC